MGGGGGGGGGGRGHRVANIDAGGERHLFRRGVKVDVVGGGALLSRMEV